MGSRVDVPRILEALSIAALHRGREWHARCPNPDHDDKDPSWRIVDDAGSERHGSHKCWSCGFGGGPWELAAAVLGVSLEEAGRRVAAIHSGLLRSAVPLEVPKVEIRVPESRQSYRLPEDVRVPSRDGSKWFVPARRYLERRAVSPLQIERWGIGFAITGEVAFRIVVPVVTGGELVSHVARSFIGATPPYHVPPPGRRGARPSDALFGEPALDRKLDYVIACEGVFKALRLELAGARNVVAVLGASNLGTSKVATLAGFSRLVVARDPDKAGARMLAELKRHVGRGTAVEDLGLERSPDDETVPRIRDALRRVGAYDGGGGEQGDEAGSAGTRRAREGAPSDREGAA